MILDSNNSKDIDIMMNYGKTKGMILVKKFFPEFFIYDRLVVFQTISDWKKLKNGFADTFFLRADTKLGSKKGVHVPGRWSDKNYAIEFIKQVNLNNKNAVIVYMEEKGLHQDGLIYTQAAFNIHFDINKFVYIDYVCPCFDASDITGGRATHVSWKIPFDEIIFFNSKTNNKYKIYTISEKAFNDSWESRKLKMFSEHPNRVDDIKGIDNKFTKCSNRIIDLITDKIILSIYKRYKELIVYTGNELGVQFNILNDDVIEVYEINRPERMY